MRYYDEIEEGELIRFEDSYSVTEEEIIEVGSRWDPQPFHIDKEAAKKSMFGGLVASSAHIFSIAVRIGNDPIDEDKMIAAVTALGFDKLQWHAPVRPGDVLRCHFSITGLRDSKSRPGLGIVSNDCRIYNQNDETVFTYQCNYLSPTRAYAMANPIE